MPATSKRDHRDAAIPTGANSASRPGEQPSPAGPVWIRPARRKAERLTLDTIVTAAIALADAEGLEAVSVRRIASELKARPMSLYSFVSRKDDLLDHMVDRVIGEMLLDEMPTDWRGALRAVARRTLDVGRRHPWVIVAIGGRPAVGPNSMRHMEQSLAAIAGLDLDGARARALLQAVDAYVIGYATTALAERHMQVRDHLTESAWHAATEEYFHHVIDSDRYPQLARLGSAELLRRAERVDPFEDGLDWLLAGFASTLNPT